MQTVSRQFLSIPRFLERIAASPRPFSSSPAPERCSHPRTRTASEPCRSPRPATFFVGGKYADTKDGPVLAGQAYAEYYVLTNRAHPYPIVMIEGCCLAGAGYIGTPDGRDGWGQYFLSKGYAVYIMDQVGRALMITLD